MYRAKVYGVAGFERQFAVKRFHPELVALPVVAQRLSAAARVYGSLEHPRIARLHEYGVAGGEVFTATELVPGLDVMRLIGGTHGVGDPLPPGAAIIVLAQVARAVGYAHGRGVNHLGLCPTNVIVTPDGDVKITDFGVMAQTLTIRPSHDDRLVQRMPYLAPEQLVGEAPSAATDVFALGALGHELVTGERAFVGLSQLDVEHAILSGHVRDAGLPKPMARVLARCFARSPFERFPDARAMADAIDAALRVAPVVGGRRELAALVKDAVARLDAMNEGQLSGAMSLALPRPPTAATTLRMGSVAGSSRTTDAVTTIRDSGTIRGVPPSAPPVAPRP
ncbi:MAG: serine/threonine protein kinase, partial [Myxococcales bacterium]|nr:serine/threonine protein kinase [Myxococcales bacterium]